MGRYIIGIMRMKSAGFFCFGGQTQCDAVVQVFERFDPYQTVSRELDLPHQAQRDGLLGSQHFIGCELRMHPVNLRAAQVGKEPAQGKARGKEQREHF